MSYWSNPDSLREALTDITSRTHISDEFMAALLEDSIFDDDKRERDDTLDEEKP